MSYEVQNLCDLLDEKGIKYVKRLHSMYKHRPTEEIERIIGRYQVVIDYDNEEYSVIRGEMASFGDYEIMNLSRKGKFASPDRFETPEELVAELTCNHGETV